MPTTRENENKEVQIEEQSVTPNPPPPRRPAPPPGRIVSFEEALAITLREDKELLSRLAK